MLLAAALTTGSANAQSTISDETWDIGFGKGVWGVVLPEYTSGTDTSGDAAYRDNLDDIGAIWQLDAIRHFHGTRTSFETRGFFAMALSNRNYEADTIGILSPSIGTPVLTSEAGTRHLDADVYHYGFDAALRDTWRTRFGGLSAGLGLSTMAFDQRFNADFNGLSLYEEDLDSSYFGGTAFVGWDGYVLGRASKIDLIYGYYDLDMDYAFRADSLPNFDTDDSESAFKVELAGSTQFHLGGHHLALTAGVMYLSDIATIERNAGRPVSIGTDDAVTMNVSLAWLW